MAGMPYIPVSVPGTMDDAMNTTSAHHPGPFSRTGSKHHFDKPMHELPKKRKTFFFSDIEGSTRLAQHLGEAYAEVLRQYYQTIRKALARHAGEEVDTAGDGFFAAFETTADAVAAAVEVQRVFHTEDWATDLDFRARIGIHSGEAIANAGGYIGLEVHRASRVCSAAHGGQILLSGVTADLLANELPRGLSLHELGEFILKDIDLAEKLVQLDVRDLPGEFPPPRISIPTHTVAVLPFRNLTNDPAQEHFCDGMAEEIIIALSRIPGLQIVARASSFALRGVDLDVRETGRRLQATALLEGAVRQMNNRLRVTVELIDTESGLNLWADRFDRKMEDLFSIQDEIARQVATALRVKLISRQRRDIRSVQTSNINAYDFYLRGRRFYYQFSRQSVEFAREMFQKAIDEDAGYALAYCGLADCYSYLYLYCATTPEHLESAQQASQSAIELDPLLGEAHAARGLALSLDGQYAKSEAAFERAIELDPQLFEAWYWYGRVTFVQGKLEKAAHLFETASEVGAGDFQALLLAGQCYDDLGLSARAEAARRRGVAVAEKYLDLNPGDTRALYLGANGLVALGERVKGLKWLQRALTLEPNDGMLLYNAGCIYALVGDTERALSCLQRAVANGLTQLGWFENDSNLDSLRGEPRFQELVERIRNGG